MASGLLVGHAARESRWRAVQPWVGEKVGHAAGALGAQEGFGGHPVLQRGLAPPRCALVCSFCVTIPVSGKLSGKEAPPAHIPLTAGPFRGSVV